MTVRGDDRGGRDRLVQFPGDPADSGVSGEEPVWMQFHGRGTHACHAAGPGDGWQPVATGCHPTPGSRLGPGADPSVRPGATHSSLVEPGLLTMLVSPAGSADQAGGAGLQIQHR